MSRNGAGRPPEAVTFDYWNTLVFEHPGTLMRRRTERWERRLRDAGIEPSPGAIEAAIGDAWKELTRAWVANESFHAVDAASLAVELLGVAVHDEVRADLVEAFLGVARNCDLQVTEGVGDCLRTLKGRGVRLGVVCDVGFTPSSVLREILDRAGLLELFDGLGFSDEVGAYKPSAAIFCRALDEVGVPPHLAAHVGDLRRTDVAGAVALGMTAVRYTGVNDDRSDGPEAHHVVARHQDVPPALGFR